MFFFRLDKLNKKGVKQEEASNLLTSAAIQVAMAPGLRDFQELSDVIFSVENKLFYLHKMILMSRCKWFEKMLSQDFAEKVTENK